MLLTLRKDFAVRTELVAALGKWDFEKIEKVGLFKTLKKKTWVIKIMWKDSNNEQITITYMDRIARDTDFKLLYDQFTQQVEVEDSLLPVVNSNKKD